MRADQKVLKISAEGAAKEKLYSDLMKLKRGRQPQNEESSKTQN